MRGAIAAGHPVTAAVGAAALEAGGNAVDACVAAGFASWVAESPLTGPGGGGFMLVHTARDGRTRVHDFFAAVPSGRREAPEEVTIVFEEGSRGQVFRVGTGTCAVPGTTAGLESAHQAHGTLPWADLVEPAVALAHDGVEVTEKQAFLHEILAPVLADTPVAGLSAGRRVAWPELGATLERIARRGAAAVYTGEIARAIARCVPAIRRTDLERYRVIRRRPVRVPYRGAAFLSNPPPSSGGVLIGLGLRHLERPGRPGTAAAVERLARVMEIQSQARARRLTRALAESGGTTHVSVVDAEGNAASLSASTGGGGSGIVVPGTGVHLNNMLGELDLMVGDPKAGERLTSMMAPSLVLDDRGVRLVLGSAGSNRLRGAIMQIVVNVVGHRLPVAEAIAAPRVHLEDGVLHLEPPLEPGRVRYEVARWQAPNLFFGGVSAVERLADGTLAAAGDPRRGGAGLVVAGPG